VKKLSSELSTCHDIIVNLRNENAKLIAKVDSNVCNDSIPNLSDDNANLLARIEKLNDSLASLKIENGKLIAKAKELDVCNASIYDLRDNNDILRAKIVELNSAKPSTSTIEHVTICTRCRDINIDVIHDHMALIKQQNDHIAKLDAKLPKRKTPIASNDSNTSFKTFDASYVLTNKSGKVVAKYVRGKHKGSKTCVWVPKVLVSNVKGPKTIWVPKFKN
jgi:DNA repair exonuclease SbcCD ATPase subunit